jgi:phospholipid/cholesterol/gamma-HCH transport system permease protein
VNLLATVGRFGLFTGRVVLATARRGLPWDDTLAQAYRVAVGALPVLLVISFFVGTTLALQGFHAFRPLGGQRLLGMFVALAGVRELAPIMVGVLVAARSGTEMASQLAALRTGHQIDALEVMALDPHGLLVTPRILGILAVLPALTLVSLITVLGSAWGVSVWQLGQNGEVFWSYVQATATLADFGLGAVKAVLFGVVICLVSCFAGFASAPGPEGVGRATNVAVVVSAVVCVLVNFAVSLLAYG